MACISTTLHGERIAAQIPDEDAYGSSGVLSAADVVHILDMIHTNIMDADDKLASVVASLKSQVYDAYPADTLSDV